MNRIFGPLCIALAAFLWATDTIFRLPLTQKFNPIWIVFFEHLFSLAVLAPLAWIRKTPLKSGLSWKDWVLLFVIGAGGSALATVLFTASFKYVNPSVSILLQKLQPIIAITLAVMFLKEKLKKSFFVWGSLAIISGLVLSFPDFNFSFLSGGLDLHSIGVIYALSAAGLWALSLVAGKALLAKASPLIATFWRFGFGAVALFILMVMAGEMAPLGEMTSGQNIEALLYMALLPGLAGVFFYYVGLKRTTASITTLVELVFPVSAVAINTFYLDQPLNPLQMGAGALLLLSVTMVSLKG